MRNKNFAFKLGLTKQPKHLQQVKRKMEKQFNNFDSFNKYFQMRYILEEPKFGMTNLLRQSNKKQSISSISARNEEKFLFHCGLDMENNQHNEIQMSNQVQSNSKNREVKLIHFKKDCNQIVIHSRKSPKCRLARKKQSSILQQKAPMTEKQQPRKKIIFEGNATKIVKPQNLNIWKDMRSIYSEMTVMSRMLSTREQCSLQRNRQMMTTRLSYRNKIANKTAIGFRTAKQKIRNDRPWSPLNSDDHSIRINNQSGIDLFFSIQQ